MATPAQPLTTADQLLARVSSDARVELVRGQERRMSPTGRRHGIVQPHLAGLLIAHVRPQSLGAVVTEVGFVIARDPDTVRAPDVAFVTAERWDAVEGEDGFFPGAPDLAVEILSPEDKAWEVEEKVLDYLEAGTRMVVLVHPHSRSLTVYRSSTNIVLLREAESWDASDVVAGLVVPVAEIFR